MKKELKLVIPCELYFESYKEAYQEDVKYRSGEDEFLCPPDIVIQQAYNYRHGINIEEGYVTSTMLWLVEGDEFIGCVDIRHKLNKNLLSFGGHIGYEIRYSKWNQGYGTKALSLALKYAKENLGINKALVTCDDDNYGSIRVIEKNGGILENVVVNLTKKGEKKKTKRYWIKIE